MSIYNSWKEVKIPVTDILLDKENYRIPKDSNDFSQKDIIEYFLKEKSYKILELAQSISFKNYINVDPIILIKEEDKYIVVEGNRRITALKVLINPELAPLEDKKKLRLMQNTINIDDIMYPKTVLANSREETNDYITTKHAEGETVIKWTPIMQSEFYENVITNLEEGQNKEDAYKALDIDDKKYIKHLNRLIIYNRICSLNYGNAPYATEITDKAKFQITTIEDRFFNNTYFTSKFKININHDTKQIEVNNDEKFDYVLTKLITWIYETPGNGSSLPKINSRTANKAQQVEKYVKLALKLYSIEITSNENQVTETSNNEEAGLSNNIHSSSYSGFDDKQSEKRTIISSESEVTTEKGLVKPKIKTRVYLEDDETAIPLSKIKNTSARKLYQELITIQVRNYPLMTAISIRILLEKIIRSNLKSFGVNSLDKNLSKPLFDKNRAKKTSRINNKKDLVEIPFGAILKWITLKDNDYVNERDTKQILTTFTEEKTFLSLFTLNNLIHNTSRTINSKDVFELWDYLDPIIKYFIYN